MVEGGHSIARLRRGAGPRHPSAGATLLLSWEARGRDGGQERCVVPCGKVCFCRQRGPLEWGPGMLRDDRKRGCAGGSGSSLRVPWRPFQGEDSPCPQPAQRLWNRVTVPSRFQRGNRGSERASHLPGVAQLRSGGAPGPWVSSRTLSLGCFPVITLTHAYILSQPYEFAFFW